jgi:TonB family protein
MHRIALTVLLFSIAVEAQAQGAISGVLVEDRNQHPLACVDVALSDRAGTVRARTQTMRDGTFAFAPGVGGEADVLQVSAQRLVTTDLPLTSVEAGAGGVRRFVLVLEPNPADTGEGAATGEDAPPVAVRGYIAPKYPDALRSSAMRGSVVLGFAVDARGRADMQSVVELQSTHAEFLRSAREAVAAARFRPARRGGRASCAFTIYSFQFDHTRP